MVYLDYGLRIGRGKWEDVAEAVQIDRIACRFGREHPYFSCPGVVNRWLMNQPLALKKLHIFGY